MNAIWIISDTNLEIYPALVDTVEWQITVNWLEEFAFYVYGFEFRNW